MQLKPIIASGICTVAIPTSTIAIPIFSASNSTISESLFYVASAFVIGTIVGFTVFTLIKKTPSKKIAPETIAKINQIKTFINAKSIDKSLTLKTTATQLGMPVSLIKQAIRAFGGKSFSQYLDLLRVELARERLRSSRTSEEFIAVSSGFKNVAALRHAFKDLLKTTPETYRKEHHIA